MASLERLTELYGNISRLDPQLLEGLRQIHAEDPAYREPEVPELTTTDPAEGICIVCRCAWFLPVQFGPCGHVFCAECLWTVLCRSSALPACMLCQSTKTNFRYRSDMHKISTDRSDFDRGRFSIILLYMKLQFLDDAYASWNIGSNDYKAFEADVNTDVEATEGIDPETLSALEKQEGHCAAGPDEDGDEWVDEDSDEEDSNHLLILLHRVPVRALKGMLRRIRFARVVVQQRLEELAPNYRAW
ncbi:predicted protein [Uncinocarpus reesii 1704]|uniref:RING-type domain-containing protein n=1 Tax=Uncinocarpus reesii (strain UAMH 1704) TaxID=336963 RepID=C4JNJ2_UNCRE|nr:uncharacterized protein UREG_02990 [Uncinocarpus reesii 1704]EEP78145.1 predicted protein [Uncinocarpus reesii 1704]